VYDYAVFDTYFAAALEADPEAYFLPHLGITPPLWWQQAHPDELASMLRARLGRSRSPRRSGDATPARTCAG